MKRRSLGIWAQTAGALVLSLGFVALGLGACSPVEREFPTGQGGSAGGMQVCTPDEQAACYTGPEGTLEVGLCKAGTHVCLPDGSGFGECGGEVLPQAENCLTIEDEGCDGPNPVECPSLGIGWNKSFGGPQEDGVLGIAHDPLTGDIVVTGVFQQAIDFGGGPMASTGNEDVFLARFDAFGNHLWSKRFGDAETQFASSVGIDGSGNIYLAGYTFGAIDFGDGKPVMNAGSSDAFVAKFDPQGNILWSRFFGDAQSQRAKNIAITPSGQVVVVGTFDGLITLSNQELASMNSDIFVIKLDSSGFDAGARRFGSQGFEDIMSVATDNQGAVYITGTFQDSIDFGPAGVFTTFGGADIYVAKLSPTLQEDWARQWGDATIQRPASIVTTPSGSVIVGGDFAGTISFGNGSINADPVGRSFFLAALTLDGIDLWSKSFGALPSSFLKLEMATDIASQSVVLGGFFNNMVDFGGGPIMTDNVDAFVAKIGWDGQHISSRAFGGPAIDGVFDVAVSPAGDVFIAGAYQGPVDYGLGPLGALDGQDIQALLMRMLP